MANSNIINAVFGSGLCAVTTSAFRANYGMVLRFSGIDLPTAFECDFSNYDVMGRDSITMIGQNGKVQIPDDLWDSGLNIYAYVYLHPTDDSGVTVYTVTIPVLGRPNRTEETPTPHEQSVIEQAISALNDAVEQTAADVASADASASAAAQSEANASVSERSAAASASAALASQNAAESAAQSATESASASAESARNAAQSASQAAQSATAAQASAEQAERSVQSITDDVERAERAAQTATDKATEAAQSAQSAASAAQNAAESEQAAQSHATDAEQAKSDAQDAKEAAEAAAESISDKAAQIAQNTADIADLVQSKAGALIDTATGSIASFVPDATIPTVRGLTVDIEPQQDLHGQDSPWPAGGGKNLFDKLTMSLNYYVGGIGGSTVGAGGTLLCFPIVSGETYTISGTNGDRTQLFYTDKSISDITSGDRLTSIIGGARLPYTFTASVNGNACYYANTEYSQSLANNFQAELGSTATSFAPYSNICPISGWDAVEVKHSGADMTNPTTYQIQLGQTVYGGTVDAVKGVLTVDRAMVTLNGTETWMLQSVNSYGIANFYKDVDHYPATNYRTACNMLSPQTSLIATTETEGYFVHQNGSTVYIRILSSRASTVNEFKTWLSQNNIQLVYTLATPIVIDLDPVTIATIANQINNVWADSGDVEVEYAADLKTYIDQKIAAAVAALS